MPDPNPAVQSLTKAQVFLRRLTSTLLLWTIVLASLFSGIRWLSDFVFFAAMVLLAAAGLHEFYGMVSRRGLRCFRWLGLVGGVLLMVGTFLHCTGRLGIHGSPSRVNDFEASFLILFVLGLCLRHLFDPRAKEGLVTIAVTLFGLMYVPYLLNFIQKINYFPVLTPGDGAFYVVYFIVVTKFSDMGAYVTGSLIGRHKMIPRISPAKTWEGFGGAIVFSTAASLGFAHLWQRYLLGMTWSHAAILGVVLSVGAVIGDLIESLFKREAGVKDSGTLFPGIGGILDLLDSLLFNAPLMYLYLRHVLTHPGGFLPVDF
ncbi:MAG: phosphatidate cytidylyltransferase [Verrucomicrobia bacterium]|nr:phosphatidate cytidylyltransferase [Verrucomicrobiota bacterium]